MHRARLAALLTVVLVALAGAQTAFADDPTIYIHYTYNCTFTVPGDNGGAIGVVPPGRYQILVTSPQSFAEVDLSGVADPTYACGGFVSFHLTGPGVNLGRLSTTATAPPTRCRRRSRAAGRTRCSTTAGRRCARPSPLRAERRARAEAAPSATPRRSRQRRRRRSTPRASSARSTAASTRQASSRLTFKGKKVASLKAGRYKVTVLDETSKRGFSLQKDGTSKATAVTTVPYLGRNTILITLKAGKWFYYSPSRGKIAFKVVSG